MKTEKKALKSIKAENLRDLDLPLKSRARNFKCGI